MNARHRRLCALWREGGLATIQNIGGRWVDVEMCWPCPDVQQFQTDVASLREQGWRCGFALADFEYDDLGEVVGGEILEIEDPLEVADDE